MGTKFVLALLALLVVGGAFVAGVLVQRHYLGPRMASPSADPDTPDAADPRREAFIEYLDGKTIDLKDPDGPTGGADTLHTVRKDEIEAVQFDKSASRVDDHPWGTRVTFILNTGGTRYGVHADVEYREVERTVVFMGFEVTELAEQ